MHVAADALLVVLLGGLLEVQAEARAVSLLFSVRQIGATGSV